MADTTTTGRATSSVITSNGTNLSIVHMKIPYQRRKEIGDKKYYLYLEELPDYVPNTNQKILVYHQDLSTSGVLENILEIKSTNVIKATFLKVVTLRSPRGEELWDGFKYAFEIIYDDDDISYTTGTGNSCRGTVVYDVSPINYEILKTIESNAIVTEKLPYDGGIGDNHLTCSSASAVQTLVNIAPMLFVDAGDSNTVFSNLFKSFNLPITSGEVAEFKQTRLGIMSRDSGSGLWYNGTEVRWDVSGSGTQVHPATGYTGMYFETAYAPLANVDDAGDEPPKIMVLEIPQTQYGEIIDGKTLKVQLPKSGGYYDVYGAFKENASGYTAGLMDSYQSETDYSASYFGNPPALNQKEYESNVVLLFCDDIMKPSGDTSKSWATGHDEAMEGERVYHPDSAVSKEFFDYYVDRCVGIAYLDRGFIVITNQTIVDYNYALYYDTGNYNNIQIASNIIVNYVDGGSVIDRDNSQFLWINSLIPTSTTLVEYLSYNTEKSMNVVCLASANEFYRTTNSTAKVLTNDTDEDYSSLKDTVSGNLYPIVITEVGLHDAQGNLLAIAKPTEPIKKFWYDVVAFTVKIRL